MGQIFNRRRVVGNVTNLPYDSKIEYLESNRYQYIDAQFYVKSTSSIRIVFSSQSDEQYNHFFGYVDNNNYLYARNAATKMFLESYGNSGYERIDLGNKTDYQVRTLVIDNNTFASGLKNATLPFYVFYASKSDDISSLVRRASMRFYEMQVYENNILVHNFIPVRIGQTGYLYDKVANQLFGNIGTRNFILGPDVN